MNRAVYGKHPGRVTFAEESTSWPKVSAPVYDGGLGFGFKWNMGWMHDTLQYMAREPIYRKYHHNDLTFGLLYAFTENFVLPLSHDEVVHGKGSLIAKMPGDGWQKFANLRAYYALHVGVSRKEAAVHGPGVRAGPRVVRGARPRLVAARPRAAQGDAGAGPRPEPALPRHAGAAPARLRGRRLRLADRRRPAELGLRLAAQGAGAAAGGGDLATSRPVPRAGYGVPLPQAGRWREILNTDAALYGGSGIGNMGGVDGRGAATAASRRTLTLPPLATIWLELETD